jgi:DUF1365 family protein
MISCAYNARTTHQRLSPPRPRFSYRLFYLFLDIDRIDETCAGTRLLSHNRPNLFSFHDRDHGERPSESLRAWTEKTFYEAGIDATGGKIMLLALPRVLGFVFNPLSVFFAYNDEGGLRGVLYEVRNTFGEKHVYAVSAQNGLNLQHADKAFHVSPFFAVKGSYSFSLNAPGDHLSMTVKNIVDGRVEHIAALVGVKVRLSDWRLAIAFLSLPMMTLGVVAAIHWQAFKLWLGGARYHSKPPEPESTVSRGRLQPRASGSGSI